MSTVNKKTLVLGASENPARYSYLAINRLKNNKHPVVAIGKRSGHVAGIPIETGKEPFDDIDTITLYVSAKNQPEWYDYILQTKPKRLIFNPNTENDELKALAEANNIQTEYACTLVLLASGQY